MALFNNKVKMIETNKEICNDRQTPFYNPIQTNYQHPIDILGNFTSMPTNNMKIKVHNILTVIIKCL